MEVEIKSNVGQVYNGKVWHVLLNGEKIGPPIKADAHMRTLVDWLGGGGLKGIATAWSLELEK